MDWRRALRRLTRWRTSAAGLAALVLTLGPTQPAFASPNRAGVSGGPAVTSPTGAQTQVSEGDQVTIAATWQGPSAGPVFLVVMDTHAVNLDAYDLLQLAAPRTDLGQQVQPIGWEGTSGGHHREGTLTFPADTPDGNPLIGPSTGGFELVIRDVGGVPERVLRWGF